MQTKAEGGFTLVELLLVIVILGILAAIVVAAVGNTSSDAAANACKAEVKTVRGAVERAVAQGLTRTSIDSYTALQNTWLADTPNQNGCFITITDGVVSSTTTNA